MLGDYGTDSICDRSVGLHCSAFGRRANGISQSWEQNLPHYLGRFRAASGAMRHKRNSTVSRRSNPSGAAGGGLLCAICEGEEIHAVGLDGIAVDSCFGGLFAAALRAVTYLLLCANDPSDLADSRPNS